MTRTELVVVAEGMGLVVAPKATKAQIEAMIADAEAKAAETPKASRAKFDFGGKLAEVAEMMADSFGAESVAAHDRHSSITIKAGKVSVTCYVKKRGLTVGCKDEVKANLLTAMPTEDVGYFEKYSNKWEITYEYGQLDEVISNLKAAMTVKKEEA